MKHALLRQIICVNRVTYSYRILSTCLYEYEWHLVKFESVKCFILIKNLLIASRTLLQNFVHMGFEIS